MNGSYGISKGDQKHKVLKRKPEGKRPLGMLVPYIHTQEDNIKLYFEETEQECVDWIHLALVRDKWCAFVDMVMKLQVPYNMDNFLTNLDTCNF